MPVGKGSISRVATAAKPQSKQTKKQVAMQLVKLSVNDFKGCAEADGAITASVKKFGQLVPVVAVQADGGKFVAVDGEKRVASLKAAGIAEVWTVIIDADAAGAPAMRKQLAEFGKREVVKEVVREVVKEVVREVPAPQKTAVKPAAKPEAKRSGEIYQLTKQLPTYLL